MTPTEFHDITRPIWNRYGGSIKSGMRTVKHNQAVGGDDDSRHLLDLAEDGVLDDPDNTVVVRINGEKRELTFNEACVNEFMRQGLYALYHKGHIHVQVR